MELRFRPGSPTARISSLVGCTLTALSITLVHAAAGGVLAVGGACASGTSAYVITQPCPDATWLAPLAILGLVIFGIIWGIANGVGTAYVFLGIGVMFISLAAMFVSHSAHTSTGAVVTMMLVMGGAGVGFLAGGARVASKNLRLPDSAPPRTVSHVAKLVALHVAGAAVGIWLGLAIYARASA